MFLLFFDLERQSLLPTYPNGIKIM